MGFADVNKIFICTEIAAVPNNESLIPKIFHPHLVHKGETMILPDNQRTGIFPEKRALKGGKIGVFREISANAQIALAVQQFLEDAGGVFVLHSEAAVQILPPEFR